jgi:hypothetical protein
LIEIIYFQTEADATMYSTRLRLSPIQDQVPPLIVCAPACGILPQLFWGDVCPLGNDLQEAIASALNSALGAPDNQISLDPMVP